VAALDLDGADLSPRLAPLRYPGRWLGGDYLLLERSYQRMAAAGGRWLVDAGGGPLELDEALAAAGATGMAGRVPVLAVGSNAAPGQLLHKFAAHPRVPGVVPVMAGQVSGLKIGHSAHVSRPGYVPWAPLAAPVEAERLTLAVLWLDAAQLGRLDATEPNYELVRVDGGRCRLAVGGGQALAAFGLYRARHGVLAGPGGAPAPASDQATVLGWLAGWFAELAGDPAEVAARLAADPDLRELARVALWSRGLALGDGLERLVGPWPG
jgi:hypothetical protein